MPPADAPPARRAAALLPRSPGVYRFRDAKQRVLYVGRATNLRSRVQSYWGDLRGRRHLARMVPQIVTLEALVCASVHEATWLERNLLEQSLPRWNRARGGQESPVYITVDERAASPGTAIAYEPPADPEVNAFGPYLGWLKARHAEAALRRLYPLSYTAADASGAELEMAIKRGVSPAGRVPFAERIRATLNREPLAVDAGRFALICQRDAASETLNFELAAKIQGELEGLEWVTAPQRVAVLGGPSHVVCGWAAGYAVTLTVKQGRVLHWEQTPGDEQSAARLVAQTGYEWIPFAQENAELAARLAEAFAIPA